MDQASFIQRLNQGLQEMGLKSPPQDVSKTLFFYQKILLKWNQKINLTAHRNPEESLEKNFLDSLVLIPYLRSCSEILDIGSGAGFPGLVIKIVLPEAKITLIESDRRKSAFLSTVIRELSLLEAQVITHHVDGGNAGSLGLKGNFDGVVSRATIPIEELLPLASSCLKENGIFLGMASFLEPPIGSMPGSLKMYLEKEVNYRLPFSNLSRKILVFRKNGGEKI
jgi:16S rRNA (guanine527-N7)-methyltransferase